MNKEKLDSAVFSLASNLFGFGSTIQKKKTLDAIANAVATTLRLDNRIMAVYPAISMGAFSITMDNYRKYIAVYNFKTNAENDLINKHNANVSCFIRQNELSEIQREFSALFVKNKQSLKARAYNENVDVFL